MKIAEIKLVFEHGIEKVVYMSLQPGIEKITTEGLRGIFTEYDRIWFDNCEDYHDPKPMLITSIKKILWIELLSIIDVN
jgi:hypothetical protein